MTSEPRLTRTGDAPKPGIVHFGPGAFFRAFNAVFTHDAIVAEGGDWGIVAVSLRSATARDQLKPQGGVYTSVSLGKTEQSQVIGSISDVRVAPENPAAIHALLADPAIRIVSLTITEKGYAPPYAPDTAIAYLTAGLAARRANGVPPFTVLSCDNLPDNGQTTRRAVLDHAGSIDPELAAYIEANVAFPSTMVDRITPATTEADLARLIETTGYTDAAAVFHESFRQWVIEDDFPMGRPAWDAAGAQLVESVAAHETMKLRCLNGTHSAMAYLGYLAGYETIFDAISDPDFAQFIEHLWTDEILPTVPQPKGEDLPAYCRALMARYRDPSIRHRTWQIAMDGSQKLPQRLLGTIRDRLKAGVLPEGLCLAVAAWMRYVGGVDGTGQPIDVRDPLADALREGSDGAATSADKVGALLAFEAIFDPELAGHDGFRSAVTRHYDTIARDGTKAAIQSVLGR